MILVRSKNTLTFNYRYFFNAFRYSHFWIEDDKPLLEHTFIGDQINKYNVVLWL